MRTVFDMLFERLDWKTHLVYLRVGFTSWLNQLTTTDEAFENFLRTHTLNMSYL